MRRASRACAHGLRRHGRRRRACHWAKRSRPYLADGKFDVVIEATGVPAIVQPALDVLELRGVLVICGIHPRPASVDLTRLVRAQQQIRGSYRAPLSTWPRALAFLRDNAKAAQAMITHRLPLDRAIEGFELARSRVASKVVIVP